MCVFLWRKRERKEKRERERELFFADLNFFSFTSFPRPFSPLSHLFFWLFLFSLFSPKKRRVSLIVKKRRPKLLITVSPIFPNNNNNNHHHHALSWSSSLSSSSGVLLRAFGVFTRGGRAKNNDA